MESIGSMSLLPALVVVVSAIFSRRPIESLLLGTVIGVAMIAPDNIVGTLVSMSQQTLREATVAWIILVCGLLGCLVLLLMRSGAVVSFSRFVAGRAKTRTGVLLSTWLLGLVIFIDDYLNAMAVSTSMKKVTDKHNVSRELLAYIVDSTAAPICILIPLSTWAVFCAGVLESEGVVGQGEGMSLYISAIPYMLYAWAAALLVPLVASGKMPLLGMMKKAERRAAGQPDSMDYHKVEAVLEGEPLAENSNAGIWNFAIPVVCLLVFTCYYDIDVLAGVMVTLLVTIPLFGLQGLMPWGDIFDTFIDGFKLMLPALAIVSIAFLFKAVNDQLGLPDFVIETVTPLMSPVALPVVTFITMGLLSFATGSFWGVFAIATPIVVPLAISLGTPLPLTIGALMSATAMGSHACFYSDSTVLAAQGCECDVMDHALTQLPYVLIAAAIASFGFVLMAVFA